MPMSIDEKIRRAKHRYIDIFGRSISVLTSLSLHPEKSIQDKSQTVTMSNTMAAVQ